MDNKIVHSSESGQKPKRRRQSTTAAKRNARAKVDTKPVVKKVPKLAMDLAKNLAGGDMSRIKVQRDGSIIVENL